MPPGGARAPKRLRWTGRIPYHCSKIHYSAPVFISIDVGNRIALCDLFQQVWGTVKEIVKYVIKDVSAQKTWAAGSKCCIIVSHVLFLLFKARLLSLSSPMAENKLT